MATYDRRVRDGTADLDRPRLIGVCGLPGVGKTTIAEDIADRVDGGLLKTDVVRKELFSDPKYTDEETRAVYRAMFERARRRVYRGGNVVLDGTFREAAFRERAAELADDCGAAFDLVKVECAEDVVRKRIERREGDASDADFEVHRSVRALFDPVRTDHVTVDNSGCLDEVRRQVDAHF